MISNREISVYTTRYEHEQLEDDEEFMENEAIFISSTIYRDGLIEMKVRCPYCNHENIHTITKDYNRGFQTSSRVCNTMLCDEYLLPLKHTPKKRKYNTH